MTTSKVPPKPNWRQSSSWVHTWLGLFFGWVLFMVFVTGTLSVFRSELSSWLKPELFNVSSANTSTSVINAIAYLQKQGMASQWAVYVPNRSPVVNVRWYGENEKPSKRGGSSAELNPASGEQIESRNTRFIDFLYRMHFELYNLPRNGARWFIGIATTAMFIALITGVIIHKRIFVDFFSFRPHKGQRSWLDLHNAVSVLALPFHLMITFSGLLLIMYLLIPWGINAAYDGDMQQYRKANGGRGGGGVVEHTLKTPEDLAGNKNMEEQVIQLIKKAQQRWPNGVSSVRILHPYGQPSYTLSQQGTNSIVGRGQSESLTYNSKTDKLTLITQDHAKISTPKVIYNVLSAWHLMRFSEPLQRWLYFISGIGGSIMIASGLLLWSKRRAEKYDRMVLPVHLKWVSVLNITAIMGLFVSIIIACWTNRLLGMSPNKTISTEIVTFFTSWSLFFVYAWLRHWIWYNPKQAWRESLLFCSVTYSTLAILDGILFLPSALTSSISVYILLSTSTVLLLLSYGAFKLATKKASAKTKVLKR